MSISQNFPAITPSLNLNFARSKKLDPRITFTRSSRATRTNAQGLIEVVGTDTPRFEHSVVGVGSTVTSIQSLGLLIEEPRNNFITYSEQFDNASWTKFNVGVTTNTSSTTAPDGSTNSELMTRTTTSAAYFLQSYTKAASSITYTTSAFVKKSVGNFCALTTQGTYPSRAAVVFNIDSGTISSSAIAYSSFTNASASITPYPNGWYRISLTATSDTHTGYTNYFSFNSNGGEIDYNDTASNSAGFIWGAQLEQATFPTSYIPTVASTVTRSGDLAFIDLPSTGWYNYSQGSLIFQHSTVPYATGTSPGYSAIGFAQTNGNSTNSIQYFFEKNDGSFQYLVRDAGANQATISVSTGAPAAKVGFAYTTNSFVLARNGSQVGTDASGTVPQSIGTLLLGTNNKAVANNLNASISNVIYYPRALSSSQLQNLTK